MTSAVRCMIHMLHGQRTSCELPLSAALWATKFVTKFLLSGALDLWVSPQSWTDPCTSAQMLLASQFIWMYVNRSLAISSQKHTDADKRTQSARSGAAAQSMNGQNPAQVPWMSGTALVGKSNVQLMHECFRFFAADADGPKLLHLENVGLQAADSRAAEFSEPRVRNCITSDAGAPNMSSLSAVSVPSASHLLSSQDGK